MNQSMKDRMQSIQELTNYIYSKSPKEREKLLSQLSSPMRDKVMKVRKLQMGRLPSAKKGHWTGERGNSNFVGCPVLRS